MVYFNCKHSKDMFYKPLADAVKHFKETEEGNKNMCEAVERYANKVAKQKVEQNTRETRIETWTNAVRNLMNECSVSIEQAFNMLKISETDRGAISKQLQR